MGLQGARVAVATIKDVEHLIEEWAPVLRRAFLDAVYNIRDRVILDQLVKALARGDIEGAVQSVGLDPAAFRGLDVAISQAFDAGGEHTASSITTAARSVGARLLVLFDARNQEAESWLRSHSGNLIKEIVEDQKIAIREHLEAGMAAGQNPKTVALDLIGRINPQTKKREGGVIGLTASQERWVKNYAAELAAADPKALQRKLRDKRFDKTTARAIKDGTPLSPDQRAKMVAAYRMRALKYRADSIARTEAMTALNQSQDTAMAQAIKKGKVQEKHVTKTWHSAGDKRVRHTHRTMNKQKVGFNERFVSPSGARLKYPGDPEASAAERVMCRCWSEIKVDFIAQMVGK